MTDVPPTTPDAEASAAKDHPESAQSPQRKSFLSRFTKPQLIAAGSIAGTIIGVVSIVVPLAVAASTTTSSTDTVAVTSPGASEGEGDGDGSGAAGAASAPLLEPIAGGVGTNALGINVDRSLASGFDEYAVPIDAPWEELWSYQQNPDSHCTDSRQLAWLQEHGTVIPPNFVTASITNTATSGSEIVVSDIRAQGQLTPPTTDTVRVGYYTCSGGGDDGIFAHLRLGVDPIAVYDDCYTIGSCFSSDPVPPVAGEPVVFGVQPGETRTLNLVYEQTIDFVGRFVATVTVGGEKSTIDLSPDAADVVSPAVTRPLPYLYIAAMAEDTRCTADRTSSSQVCSLADWLAVLAAP
ncbi:hypothetical protein H4J02_08975 [Protaetiibacter sp. SSC-01]|uniref:hypothetical protein n=1 Tax=Protaetiibacter sp. SSC-01 TaxID=2759943 RepID=UPI001656A5B0|nr:hypothetical protein [Protaetiibacter sp. SSC-01]QNO36632.1 hypothetical protein H4J02_08975 [Protaetiibacter sp. SSC-01]